MSTGLGGIPRIVITMDTEWIPQIPPRILLPAPVELMAHNVSKLSNTRNMGCITVQLALYLLAAGLLAYEKVFASWILTPEVCHTSVFGSGGAN
jgi:hypothetical protein